MSDEREEEQEESDCGNPCDYHGCPECEDYWSRMVREGFWEVGQGWTKKAMAQW